MLRNKKNALATKGTWENVIVVSSSILRGYSYWDISVSAQKILLKKKNLKNKDIEDFISVKVGLRRVKCLSFHFLQVKVSKSG